jgi:hypothetical protein
MRKQEITGSFVLQLFVVNAPELQAFGYISNYEKEFVLRLVSQKRWCSISPAEEVTSCKKMLHIISN